MICLFDLFRISQEGRCVQLHRGLAHFSHSHRTGRAHRQHPTTYSASTHAGRQAQRRFQALGGAACPGHPALRIHPMGGVLWRFGGALVERLLRVRHPLAVAPEEPEWCDHVKRRRSACLLKPFAFETEEELR